MKRSRYITFLSMVAGVAATSMNGPAFASPKGKTNAAKKTGIACEDKNDPRLVQSIAMIKDNRFKEALTILNGFSGKGKVEARRLFQLARAMARTGDLKGAIENNSRAYAIDPSLINAIYNNACFASLSGDIAGTKKYFTTLVQAVDDRSDAKMINKLGAFYTDMLKKDPDLAPFRKADPKAYQYFYSVFSDRVSVSPEPSASWNPEVDGDTCAACGGG